MEKNAYLFEHVIGFMEGSKIFTLSFFFYAHQEQSNKLRSQNEYKIYIKNGKVMDEYKCGNFIFSPCISVEESFRQFCFDQQQMIDESVEFILKMERFFYFSTEQKAIQLGNVVKSLSPLSFTKVTVPLLIENKSFLFCEWELSEHTCEIDVYIEGEGERLPKRMSLFTFFPTLCEEMMRRILDETPFGEKLKDQIDDKIVLSKW